MRGLDNTSNQVMRMRTDEPTNRIVIVKPYDDENDERLF